MRKNCNHSMPSTKDATNLTLGMLVNDIFDGPRQVEISNQGVPYIRLGDLVAGEVIQNPLSCIDNRNLEDRFFLRQDDVLVTKTGEEPRAVVVSGGIIGSVISPDIYCLRLNKSSFSPIWLMYYLNSKVGQCLLSERSIGDKIRRLRLADLRSMPIVIPTVSLVREVEELEQLALEHNLLAHQIWAATLRGLYNEIFERFGQSEADFNTWFERITKKAQRDPVDRSLKDYLLSIFTHKMFRPLSEVAKIAIASRKNIQPDQIVKYVQTSDVDSQSFLFRRVRSSKAKDLPARIRLPLHSYQVLILASGSNLGTPSHPVAIVEPKLDGCYASNTFLALEFDETPLYYGMVLKHPIVLAQLCLLAVGQVVSTLSKKDVTQLRIPVLGSIWRQDFNDRARMAWERRTLALELRQQAMQKAEMFIQQSLRGGGN